MKKISTFVDVLMIIIICGGIVFGTWRDGQSGLSKLVMCDYDRIEDFLGVTINFWIGMKLLFKPPSFIKDLPGANWLSLRLGGLFFLFMSMLGLWHPYFPNCQP